MANLTPETDMGAALATALGLVDGTDIKYGEPRSPTEPGNAAAKIWLTPYGGQVEPLLNAAVEGSRYRGFVQALVRGPVGKFQDGLALARSVRDALHCKQASAYVSWCVKPGFGEPHYLGVNEANQPQFSVNFVAEWFIKP